MNKIKFKAIATSPKVRDLIDDSFVTPETSVIGGTQ